MQLLQIMNLFVWSFVVSSCVTTYKKQKSPASIPVVFQSLFQACYPVDGEANLNVFENSNREFTSTMVWNIPRESETTIQFNSPVGDTIFQMEKSSGTWKTTGQIQLDIKESEQEIISINDHRIPILSTELGCVLSGGWPNEWLNKLQNFERRANSLSLSGGDHLRDITLDAFIQKNGTSFRASDIKSCAVVKWGGFWGLFRNTAHICREQIGGKVTMKITGVNSYVVEWVIVNES